MSASNAVIPNPSDRLLNVKQAAEVLGCSPRMIDRLRVAGALYAVKLGRSTRYRLSDVERLVQEGAAR
ncbi:MAG: helix-turn-helix domain-containing protein [Planctomycetes bacterium]|nr:helix-turn-helix domain-containing protein [Planctomycetota bacterium]